MQAVSLLLVAFGVLLRPNAVLAAPILAAYAIWPMRFDVKRTAIAFIPALLLFSAFVPFVYYGALRGDAIQHVGVVAPVEEHGHGTDQRLGVAGRHPGRLDRRGLIRAPKRAIQRDVPLDDARTERDRSDRGLQPGLVARIPDRHVVAGAQRADHAQIQLVGRAPAGLRGYTDSNGLNLRTIP